MTLVWSIPVVAAAVAALVLVARSRATEDEAAALHRAVTRLAELRRPLSAVRDATAETDAVASRFRARHPLDDAPRGEGEGSHGGG